MQEVDAELSTLDRAIINAFQGGFPVAERPFDAAAAALRERDVDVTGAELCERVRELDEEGILSRFGALVNAEEIGGAASLVAMHAPEKRYEAIAETVNEFTAVAHNYEREHPHLNMWFVVSVADHPDPDKDGSDRVEEVLAEIEDATGQETYNLPKLQEFHVGAKFLVDGPVSDGDVDLSDLGPDVTPSDRGTLTPDERDLVVEIQGGLPITETPYADVAAAIGADVDWVIETIKRFEREEKVRRVGVIPNHYALGYTENGMTVWNVPEDVLDEVGPAVAALDFVTHCYERPRHAGVWEYNFFAMTHGRTEAESERRIAEVRELMDEYWDVGAEDWDTLFSTRILKKTGIRIADRADSNTA
ncbi:AsnC family transcriptional regulator [Halorubrum californiense DSM 19288]|uniref:siroheme decarboxylase n=1 Tax=Halorubrum californiense DSM 19288 TaxID=1227465 RepID=M0DZR3_9EURY|nr:MULTISPECIES: Lrp/AsnC family transcriptional regulator [Halorubrum]ELZ40303.1 AsnC family transcriptional regulator [Halorubrum californiense DSM 19288]TKX68120.1 Lrp/AsnC family transcriptional regulator [Halorubrum sp. GN11GM_10-3_MGM]